MKPVVVINGDRFSSLDEFYDEVERVLLDEDGRHNWGRNLDALDDVLSGAMGAPEDDFVLIWRNSSLSRERLNYAQMTHVLTAILRRCHESARPQLADRISAARNETGPTLFDWIVEIISSRPNITLRLE